MIALGILISILGTLLWIALFTMDAFKNKMISFIVLIIILCSGIGSIAYDVTSPTIDTISVSMTNKFPKSSIIENNLIINVKSTEGDYFYTQDIFILEQHSLSPTRKLTISNNSVYYVIKKLPQ